MLTDSEGDYPPTLRIGDYRVDAAIDEISRDGVVCKLEPRGMSLLLCLARHAGQVVSVDRLLEEVWKEVVVNPDSVYQTVATLRRTLRDDAKDPQYIATVVRRGYRLIAPVSVWEGSGTASSTDGSVVVTDQRESAEVRIAEGPAAPLPPPATQRSHASIAILPFANLTGDSTKEYLGDGIAEELINTLHGLRVGSRSPHGHPRLPTKEGRSMCAGSHTISMSTRSWRVACSARMSASELPHN